MNYIRRSNDGTLVSDKTQLILLNKGIYKYLDDLCIRNYSTLEGRRKAIKYAFDMKQNTPIYVDHKTVFFVSESPRNYEAIFVNYHELASHQNIGGGCQLFFKDGTILVLKKPYKSILQELRKVQMVYEQISSQ